MTKPRVPDSTAPLRGVARPKDPPEVCVVVPAYNEGSNVDALYGEVSSVLDDLDIEYAFLFVDDGSVDDTPERLAALRERDPRVSYLSLARNFGLQAALAAGLSHAPGSAVIVMDADLQDDPAALPEFLVRWRNGAQVVYAIRTERKEGLIKRILFAGFHMLLSRLASISIPRGAGSFALYDRIVVDHLNSLPERNRYLPGLRAWVGLRQEGVQVARRERHSGPPVQSYPRLFSLALDGLLSFSKAPLRLASLLGLIVTAMAGVGLVVIFYWRFIERSFPTGVGLASIAFALLFLGGVQLMVLGVMGEYLGRVYDEVKRRPVYILAKSVGVPAEPAPAPEKADASVPLGAWPGPTDQSVR